MKIVQVTQTKLRGGKSENLTNIHWHQREWIAGQFSDFLFHEISIIKIAKKL
jgi:hypothetical protein